MDEVLFAVLDDFGLRVVHRPRLESYRLAEHDHLVAYRKILLHERQVPPAAMQPRCPVIENQFKDGLRVLLKPLHAEGDDGAPRGGRLAELQLGNGPEMPAVLVAPWPMQEQVFDGANLQPCQLRRAFRADAGQRGHRSGKRRDRLSWARQRSSSGTIQCDSPQSEARNPTPRGFKDVACDPGLTSRTP